MSLQTLNEIYRKVAAMKTENTLAFVTSGFYFTFGVQFAYPASSYLFTCLVPFETIVLSTN
jgi:hypothetical protein